MKSTLYLVLLALLCAYAFAGKPSLFISLHSCKRQLMRIRFPIITDCSVSIKQTLGSTWEQEGSKFSQWNVVLTAGSEAVKSVDLTLPEVTQIWELQEKQDGHYALPEWRLQNGGIPAGQTHTFGYIWQSASQATITASANCGSAASPSAAPASPSASAAAPSPSAALATPSPSANPTIVASPQPNACNVRVNQTARSTNLGGTWTEGDYKFQIYDLTVTNIDANPITSTKLTINLNAGQQITQSWNLDQQTGTTYTVSTAFGPLQVGSQISVGYVVKSLASENAAQPTISIDAVTCSGVAPSASPAAPSPSAAPATPSPSANPTIVATPQPSSAPSGCSATVSLVARSADAGGVWQDNGKTFQIFDITFTNNGARPLNGGVITFTLAGSAAITQSWELSRQGSTSNSFNIRFNYGPLQVGASQGAGIVVGVDGATPAGKPSYTLSSLGCQ